MFFSPSPDWELLEGRTCVYFILGRFSLGTVPGKSRYSVNVWKVAKKRSRRRRYGGLNRVRQIHADLENRSVIVSFLGPHNKWPQTRWFKTAEIYSLTIPDSRMPKSRFWQGRVLSADLRRILPFPFLASSGPQQSFMFLGLWLHYSNLFLLLHMPSSLWVLCPSYKDTSHWI